MVERRCVSTTGRRLNSLRLWFVCHPPAGGYLLNLALPLQFLGISDVCFRGVISDVRDSADDVLFAELTCFLPFIIAHLKRILLACCCLHFDESLFTSLLERNDVIALSDRFLTNPPDLCSEFRAHAT